MEELGAGRMDERFKVWQLRGKIGGRVGRVYLDVAGGSLSLVFSSILDFR